MSELGFIYVLANSSMPGLVKVGKTTRTPSERAGELAGVTGLPTPFIVVYEQLFQDCGTAEAFVHAYLAEKGHRVADNREFFNAPTNIVVRAISLAPGAIDGNSTLAEGKDSKPTQVELNNAYPWASVLAEAESHYLGTEDRIKDNTRALKLFKQAAKLGALSAYRYICEIYFLEKQIGKEHEYSWQGGKKLLEIYKDAANKGSAYCLWETGMVLMYGNFAVPIEGSRKFRGGYHTRNQVDANKCFNAFIKLKPWVNLGSGVNQITSDELNLVHLSIQTIIVDTFHYEKDRPEFIQSQWDSLKAAILHSASTTPDGKTRIMSESETVLLLQKLLERKFVANS